MNKPKSNLPASIHQRLLNIAKKENRPLNELLQYYAIERFLFRLGSLPLRENFILKGAQMLKAWTQHTLTRPTMDIDLLGRVNNEPENLEEIVCQCCLVEIEDGVVFDPQTISSERIKKDAKYQGVRIFVKGLLGKIRLSIQIDFGFGDRVFPAPIEISLPQLLDMGSPQLLGYPPETTIAEKFQAMIALDLENTRYKDFYDIWFLSRNLRFSGESLQKAIKATFDERKTNLSAQIPNALTANFTDDPTKQMQWKAFLRKNRLDSKIELSEVAGSIEDFLMPVVQALVKKEEFSGVWSTEDGWQF
jgi:hypothetical protein